MDRSTVDTEAKARAREGQAATAPRQATTGRPVPPTGDEELRSALTPHARDTKQAEGMARLVELGLRTLERDRGPEAAGWARAGILREPGTAIRELQGLVANKEASPGAAARGLQAMLRDAGTQERAKATAASPPAPREQPGRGLVAPARAPAEEDLARAYAAAGGSSVRERALELRALPGWDEAAQRHRGARDPRLVAEGERHVALRALEAGGEEAARGALAGIRERIATDPVGWSEYAARRMAEIPGGRGLTGGKDLSGREEAMARVLREFGGGLGERKRPEGPEAWDRGVAEHATERAAQGEAERRYAEQYRARNGEAGDARGDAGPSARQEAAMDRDAGPDLRVWTERGRARLEALWAPHLGHPGDPPVEAMARALAREALAGGIEALERRQGHRIAGPADIEKPGAKATFLAGMAAREEALLADPAATVRAVRDETLRTQRDVLLARVGPVPPSPYEKDIARALGPDPGRPARQPSGQEQGAAAYGPWEQARRVHKDTADLADKLERVERQAEGLRAGGADARSGGREELVALEREAARLRAARPGPLPDARTLEGYLRALPARELVPGADPERIAREALDAGARAMAEAARRTGKAVASPDALLRDTYTRTAEEHLGTAGTRDPARFKAALDLGRWPERIPAMREFVLGETARFRDLAPEERPRGAQPMALAGAVYAAGERARGARAQELGVSSDDPRARLAFWGAVGGAREDLRPAGPEAIDAAVERATAAIRTLIPANIVSLGARKDGGILKEMAIGGAQGDGLDKARASVAEAEKKLAELGGKGSTALEAVREALRKATIEWPENQARRLGLVEHELDRIDTLRALMSLPASARAGMIPDLQGRLRGAEERLQGAETALATAQAADERARAAEPGGKGRGKDKDKGQDRAAGEENGEEGGRPAGKGAGKSPEIRALEAAQEAATLAARETGEELRVCRAKPGPYLASLDDRAREAADTRTAILGAMAREAADGARTVAVRDGVLAVLADARIGTGGTADTACRAIARTQAEEARAEAAAAALAPGSERERAARAALETTEAVERAIWAPLTGAEKGLRRATTRVATLEAQDAAGRERAALLAEAAGTVVRERWGELVAAVGRLGPEAGAREVLHGMGHLPEGARGLIELSPLDAGLDDEVREVLAAREADEPRHRVADALGEARDILAPLEARLDLAAEEHLTGPLRREGEAWLASLAPALSDEARPLAAGEAIALLAGDAGRLAGWSQDAGLPGEREAVAADLAAAGRAADAVAGGLRVLAALDPNDRGEALAHLAGADTRLAALEGHRALLEERTRALPGLEARLERGDGPADAATLCSPALATRLEGPGSGMLSAAVGRLDALEGVLLAEMETMDREHLDFAAAARERLRAADPEGLLPFLAERRAELAMALERAAAGPATRAEEALQGPTAQAMAELEGALLGWSDPADRRPGAALAGLQAALEERAALATGESIGALPPGGRGEPGGERALAQAMDGLRAELLEELAPDALAGGREPGALTRVVAHLATAEAGLVERVLRDRRLEEDLGEATGRAATEGLSGRAEGRRARERGDTPLTVLLPHPDAQDAEAGRALLAGRARAGEGAVLVLRTGTAGEALWEEARDSGLQATAQTGEARRFQTPYKGAPAEYGRIKGANERALRQAIPEAVGLLLDEAERLQAARPAGSPPPEFLLVADRDDQLGPRGLARAEGNPGLLWDTGAILAAIEERFPRAVVETLTPGGRAGSPRDVRTAAELLRDADLGETGEILGRGWAGRAGPAIRGSRKEPAGPREREELETVLRAREAGLGPDGLGALALALVAPAGEEARARAALRGLMATEMAVVGELGIRAAPELAAAATALGEPERALSGHYAALQRGPRAGAATPDERLPDRRALAARLTLARERALAEGDPAGAGEALGRLGNQLLELRGAAEGLERALMTPGAAKRAVAQDLVRALESLATMADERARDACGAKGVRDWRVKALAGRVQRDRVLTAGSEGTLSERAAGTLRELRTLQAKLEARGPSPDLEAVRALTGDGPPARGVDAPVRDVRAIARARAAALGEALGGGTKELEDLRATLRALREHGGGRADEAGGSRPEPRGRAEMAARREGEARLDALAQDATTEARSASRGRGVKDKETIELGAAWAEAAVRLAADPAALAARRAELLRGVESATARLEGDRRDPRRPRVPAELEDPRGAHTDPEATTRRAMADLDREMGGIETRILGQQEAERLLALTELEGLRGTLADPEAANRMALSALDRELGGATARLRELHVRATEMLQRPEGSLLDVRIDIDPEREAARVGIYSRARAALLAAGMGERVAHLSAAATSYIEAYDPRNPRFSDDEIGREDRANDRRKKLGENLGEDTALDLADRVAGRWGIPPGEGARLPEMDRMELTALIERLSDAGTWNRQREMGEGGTREVGDAEQEQSLHENRAGQESRDDQDARTTEQFGQG